MIDKKYRDYLHSKEWRQIRLDIITDRKKCEYCGSKKRLCIHHKHYRNIFNEDPEDLELLCGQCHDKEHNIKKKKPQPKNTLSKKKRLKLKAQEKRKKLTRERRKSERNYQRFALKYY